MSIFRNLYDLTVGPILKFARKPQPTTGFDFFYLSVVYLFKLLLKTLVLVLLLEVCVRIIHLGAMPVMPYQVREQTPVMPANAQFTVKLTGHQRALYVTDELGARVLSADQRRADCTGGVLVVGDSQALGWGISFEDTLGSRVAELLLHDRGRARTIGAPATDPEHNLHSLTKYRNWCSGAEKLSILILNLGNDLDEMYLGRWESLPQSSGSVSSWLTLHSSLYVDLTILKRKLDGSKEDLVPGINSIMYALNRDEQDFLADRTAEIMLNLVRLAQPSENVMVVVVPQDYQVAANQFDKYRPYYDSDQEFNDLKAKIPEYSRRMTELEEHISRKLSDSGLTVLRFSDIASGSDRVDDLFEHTSHHLTPIAYQLLANRIVNSLPNTTR
jgi:hypothetical protein